MRPRTLLVLASCLLAIGCAAGSRRSDPIAWPRPSAEGEVSARTLAAIHFAEAQVGKRYCWGGTGPDCFDCSGLVQAAWRWGGVKLPRTSDAQGRALAEVPLEHTRPGDILWWRGHVGLYVGGGLMVDAYHAGAGVVRRPAAIPERVLRVESPPLAAREPSAYE